MDPNDHIDPDDQRLAEIWVQFMATALTRTYSTDEAALSADLACKHFLRRFNTSKVTDWYTPPRRF